METSSELKSTVKNILYYCEKVRQLSEIQFKKDYDAGQLTGINTGPGSIRFDCLGAIMAATKFIDAYCQNIEVNIESAEKLDKELRPILEAIEEATREKERIEQEIYQ